MEYKNSENATRIMEVLRNYKAVFYKIVMEIIYDYFGNMRNQNFDISYRLVEKHFGVL